MKNEASAGALAQQVEELVRHCWAKIVHTGDIRMSSFACRTQCWRCSKARVWGISSKQIRKFALLLRENCTTFPYIFIIECFWLFSPSLAMIWHRQVRDLKQSLEQSQHAGQTHQVPKLMGRHNHKQFKAKEIQTHKCFGASLFNLQTRALLCFMSSRPLMSQMPDSVTRTMRSAHFNWKMRN